MVGLVCGVAATVLFLLLSNTGGWIGLDYAVRTGIATAVVAFIACFAWFMLRRPSSP